MASAMLQSFSGALQASLSVLLVIIYGVIASQFGLIDNASAKKVSRISVKMFLPFLLITKLGKELTLENATKYVPVLIWSIVYNVVSILIGLLGVKFFSLPAWVTPAIAFNNTTSLPLLLIQSMESTGILQGILKNHESVSDAISRAQSYFLVSAVVSNCLVFAVGPVLLDGEEAYDDNDHQPGNGSSNPYPIRQPVTNEEEEEETTSLLPDRIREIETQAYESIHDTTHDFLHRHHVHFDDFSRRTNRNLSIIGAFFNGPLVGAAIGLLIGLVPALHRAFFSNSQEGGIFTAWLTESLRNTGELFVSLQVIVVGVKLSSSLRKMKRGDDSAGKLAWNATLFVFFVRYLFWPIISIPVIYGLAKSGFLFGKQDAVLWFCLMLIPTGPPAL